jgi:hypothetical protein
LRHISKSSADKRIQSDKVSRYAHSDCTSQTNWYASFCPDPPNAPCVQLAQPFFNLIDREPYSRVTEVSVLDGVITIGKNKNKRVEMPILMATRAAGITHSLLGLVTRERACVIVEGIHI